ncbi:LysR family transcriptional regulator [Caballeronia fortuita]|uniref:LysR family transcriptional regulator n=2 Tax=Caballeronia fortuita TaxID=1777138 RepID=A0A158CAR1_9BURK|nr:LysR family transcriptional regulator [Caballeronia fortuita]
MLQDPLFTRTRDGMVPTFNATQLFKSFKNALNSIESAISATSKFDPTTSQRSFRLALSDLGELYFLPLLVRELQCIAPSVGLEIVQIVSSHTAEWLQTGYVDAVVGNQQYVGGEARKTTLFNESYSCLVSRSHPTIGDTLTLEEFVAANHVVVAPFTGHHLVEDVLSEMGLTRKIVLRVPHFTSLFSSIATTDLVLTLPTRVARAYAREGQMKVLPLPFQIPAFEVNLYWYPHAEDSAAQQWFCETIKRTLSDV